MNAFVLSNGSSWITHFFQVGTSSHFFSFLGLCWDTVDMSVSLLSGKHLGIQQLVHSLLSRQPVTVHLVVSFLDKTTFCVNGHAHLCQWCCVIQSDIKCLQFSSSLILSFLLSLPGFHQLWSMSQLQQSLVPLHYPF